MSEQNPNPPSSFKRMLQRHPVAAAVIAIVCFVVWTLPVGIAQAWPAFVRDKTIPEWLAERRWPGMTAQLYGWLTIVFFLALAILLVVIVVISKRKGASHQPASTTEASPPQPESSSEDLTKRIEELEHEKTALEKARDGAIKAHEEARGEIERLQRQAETQSVQISVREGLLEKYKWLHERADTQSKDISNYIELVEIRWCYEELDTGLTRTVFALDIFNKSVFGITIEKEVGGLIYFAGTDLLEKKSILNDPVRCKSASKASITIEQRLSPSEVHLIKTSDRRMDGFNIEHLVITIKGNEGFPLQPQRLQITQRGSILRSNQSTTEKLNEEIEALKAQRISDVLDCNKRTLVVDRLARFVAMGHEYFNQSHMRQPLSKVNLAAWLEGVASEIKRFFGDDAVKEFYDNSDVAPPPPDTLDSQMEWVRRYCMKANEIISQQYRHRQEVNDLSVDKS